jgi:hypothetical protein
VFLSVQLSFLGNVNMTKVRKPLGERARHYPNRHQSMKKFQHGLLIDEALTCVFEKFHFSFGFNSIEESIDLLLSA